MNHFCFEAKINTIGGPQNTQSGKSTYRIIKVDRWNGKTVETGDLFCFGDVAESAHHLQTGNRVLIAGEIAFRGERGFTTLQVRTIALLPEVR